MLVVSRKLGQRILIGPDVAVTIVEIHRDRVKLSFDAPRHVTIHRQEVFVRIKAEQLAESKVRQSSSRPEFASTLPPICDSRLLRLVRQRASAFNGAR